MVDEGKIDVMTRIWNLYSVVQEGISYLAAHPQNKQIRQDIRAGIDTIISCTKTYDIPKDIWKDFKAQISASQLNISALNAAAAQLSNAIAEAVSKALLDIIQNESYITKDVAAKIFQFYDQAPHMNNAIFQLIFKTCYKCAVSMPKESFDYTMRVFEEQPGLLSQEGNVHPGYVYHPAEQRTFERCPVCGGSGIPYYRAMAYAINSFEPPHLPAKLWMKCETCGNLYTWKFPEEILGWSAQHKLITPDPNSYLTAQDQSNTNGYTLSIWSNILNKLSAYTTGKTLLEVGVGSGALLAVALEMGYDVEAIELSEETAQNISNMLGIGIWNEDFLNYSADKTYSVIVMGDVIEHVQYPEKALQNAYRLLDKDGVLWLSTPNFESSFSRMHKFSDPMWCEPWHISYFSYRGLEPLILKCGFEVKEYTVSNRYNGSMELILTKNMK